MSRLPRWVKRPKLPEQPHLGTPIQDAFLDVFPRLREWEHALDARDDRSGDELVAGIAVWAKRRTIDRERERGLLAA